jgi:hypothetical protein
MELRMSLSRSGSPTCSAGNVWLHSRYDPELEARRFAQEELGSSSPSHVVLLGPCLGYLASAVRSLRPGARIVSVQFSGFFAEQGGTRADASWDPISPLSLESFLDKTLDEDAISGVAVLEWEAASKVFPEEANAAKAAVKASLDRLAASSYTVKTSGRRWIANSCASFLLAKKACRAEATEAPILVASAGPSLWSSLLELPKRAEGFVVLAVSSALSACLRAGIAPDLVVASDGGYWSRLHLYPLIACPLPLATPLTALPSAAIYRGTPLTLIHQGTFAESELLPFLGDSIALPPHGTVSGTAIQLAARLTSGPIVVAGLDLASFGDQDHARPHGFEPVLVNDASRIAPMETASWSRASASAPILLRNRPWRSSRSLGAYASALEQDALPLAGRLFRLNPSPQRLVGFQEIGREELRSLAEELRNSIGPLRLTPIDLPALEEREAFLRDRLSSWKALASSASMAMIEGTLPSRPLVAELLRSIDIVDYAAASRAVLADRDPTAAARALAARCELFLASLETRFSS